MRNESEMLQVEPPTLPTPSEWMIDAHLGLKPFADKFNTVQPYICLLLSCIGIIANAVVCVILFRGKHRTATKHLLAAFGLSNLVPLLPTSIFISQYIVSEAKNPKVGSPYKGWVIYVICYHNIRQLSHTCSLMLLVTLATFQCINIGICGIPKRFCKKRRSKWAIAACVMGALALCSTSWPEYGIRQKIVRNQTIYWSTWTDVARANNNLLVKVNFWLHGCFLALGGSVLLAILMGTLAIATDRLRRRKKRLLTGSQRKRAEKQCNQTTWSLLACIGFAVITEVPIGVMNLLTAVYGVAFYQLIYLQLGPLLDMLGYIQSTTCFLLYSAMNGELRRAVYRQLFARCLRCSEAKPDDDGEPKRQLLSPALPARWAKTNDVSETNDKTAARRIDRPSNYGATKVSKTFPSSGGGGGGGAANTAFHPEDIPWIDETTLASDEMSK